MTTTATEPLRAAPESPRQVYCIVESAHRSRPVADDARGGAFTHSGVTVELGVPPDWERADLPSDPEWLIEWGKFYWGLDIAHAYRETGDTSYVRAWERLIDGWISGGRPPLDRSYTLGRRVQNWIYAWNGFARREDFPGVTESLAARIVQSMDDQVRDLRRDLSPERNHRTIELYALFLFALAFPSRDPAGELLAFASQELHRNLMIDIRPDGVHREASTHYHLIALRSWLGAYVNAQGFGVALPAGYATRLEAACDFALHCHRPDGGIPALSDADGGSYLDVLGVAAEALGRPDLLHASTRGRRGTPPRRRCVLFPEGGYAFQRSGFGERDLALADERFLVFDCGPLGDGGHGHYDLLSIEIACDGGPAIVDPGRFTYAEDEPNLRHWFKGTAAHNTVVVDGQDQTPYRRGKPKGPIAEGRLLCHVGGAGLDLVAGEATSPSYEAVHRRHIAFVDDSYWVIEDRLDGAVPHTFDLRFHLAHDAYGHAEVARNAEGAVVLSPRVGLTIHGAAATTIEEGWVSPDYGVRHPAPVISSQVTGETRARFLTVVAPASLGAPPTIRRLHGVCDDASATVVEVVWSAPRRRRDVVAMSERPVETRIDGYEMHGAVGFVSIPAEGPARVLAYGSERSVAGRVTRGDGNERPS